MHGEVSAITYQQPTWLEEIRNEALHDPKLSSIKEAMQKGTQCAGVVRYISSCYDQFECQSDAPTNNYAIDGLNEQLP